MTTGPSEKPTIIVRDFTSLQEKWIGYFNVAFSPEVEDRADASAVALDQLITDIGAETMRRMGIEQIFICGEMHAGSGAFYFSVNHTLAKNMRFLRGRLGLSLPYTPSDASDEAQEKPAVITPEDLFEDPKAKLRKKIRMVIAATIAACLGGAAGGVSWHLTRPNEITANCSIRFIPETESYRASCDITEAEGLQPTLQFQPRTPELQLIGWHEADLSFSRKGRICNSKRKLPVRPETTTKLPAEAFTCVVAPPLTRAAPPLK